MRRFEPEEPFDWIELQTWLERHPGECVWPNEHWASVVWEQGKWRPNHDEGSADPEKPHDENAHRYILALEAIRCAAHDHVFHGGSFDDLAVALKAIKDAPKSRPAVWKAWKLIAKSPDGIESRFDTQIPASRPARIAFGENRVGVQAEDGLAFFVEHIHGASYFLSVDDF